MKDWQKRRDIESLNNPQTRSFTNGWNEGRTDTLKELSFVREALMYYATCLVAVSAEDMLTLDGVTYAGMRARDCISRLDALTGDGEEKNETNKRNL